MAVRDDVLARKWLVGRTLTTLREAAGVRQATVGTELGVSPGMVSQYEVGKHFPESRHIHAMMRLYGASTAAATRLAKFAELPAGPDWLKPWEGLIRPYFRRFVGAEGFATRQIRYAPLVIPALLQTRAYAEGMAGRSPRVSRAAEQPLVQLRVARQQRVLDGDLHLTAIVEESVLDRPPGTADEAARAEVMREQLLHLKELAARPNVDIFVVPTSVGYHAALTGPFCILHFDDEEGEPTVGQFAYVESLNDARYATEHDQVADYTRAATETMAVALSQEDSLGAIDARLNA